MNSVTKIEWVALSVVIICVLTYITVQMRASTVYNFEAYINKHKPFLHITTLKNMHNNVHNNAENIFTHISNGDLIFFCGDTKGERTCRWCTGSMFSHVAMLFREINIDTHEDVVYVWEADVGQHSKRGPRVMKLADKLKKYHGFPYFMWRNLVVVDNSKRPTTENILRVVDEYKNYEFDDSMMSWWISNFPQLNNSAKNTVFCSELIALTLKSKHINMMDDTHIAAWYSPGTFTHTNIQGLYPGYTYSSAMFVDFGTHKK